MTITPISTPPPCSWSSSFPSHEVSTWRRIRRYAVPRWMIEQATERRMAGDWRGACAAANIDIAFDLADVAKEHGKEVAAAIEDDLLHLAPDLLRWHLPRVGRGRTTITPDQAVILSRPEEASSRQDAPQLHISTPRWMVHGPQRLTLRFGPVAFDGIISLETDWRYCSFWRGVVHDWTTARHLWDVRRTDELRQRCGGGKGRAPFFNSDGTSRTADQLPTTDPGHDDPAAHTEWVTALHDKGDVEAAFTAVGIELGDISGWDLKWSRKTNRVEPLEILERLPLALTRLEPEIQRLTARHNGYGFRIPYTQHAMLLLRNGEQKTGLRVFTETYLNNDADTDLAEAFWRRLPDLDLLRTGHITPEQLHPLVRDALFPDRLPADRPAELPGIEPSAPVRVRCRGEWHEISSHNGSLRIPHSDQERRREHAIQAIGGAITGCFAAQHAWTTGRGRLPKALDDQRQDFFARIHHGDTPGVIQMLDAGIDPHVRDTRQRTLLHLLHLVDHKALFPRLLAAGLDINATDCHQRTPLFAAICEDGSAELIQALLTAGAHTDVIAIIRGDEISLYRLINWHPRRDLQFLSARIEHEHPDLDDVRQMLRACVQLRDTPGILRLLDAGVDPHLCDAYDYVEQRTLLHVLHRLDHKALLPRLLAAGVDVNATDEDQWTPLQLAVDRNGSAELVRALLIAGARTDTANKNWPWVYRTISSRNGDDLHFLKEILEHDHPDLVDPDRPDMIKFDQSEFIDNDWQGGIESEWPGEPPF